MKRRLFNVLAAVSLMLCIAMAALCVTARYRFVAVVYERGDGCLYEVAGWTNDLLFGFYVPAPFATARARGFRIDNERLGNGHRLLPPKHAVLGFAWETTPDGPRSGGTLYHGDIPYWFLMVLTLALSAILFRTAYRWREKLALNCCIRCGYDLRATPERCPECGSAVRAAG